MKEWVGKELEGHPLLFCESLKVNHGFLGSSLHFVGQRLSSDLDTLKALLDVDSVFLPRQVHRDDIIVIQSKRELEKLVKATPESVVGDAIVVPKGLDVNVALAIRTADCLPVIIESEKHCALVHAGWRGLASQIVPKVIDYLKSEYLAESLGLYVGPSASISMYEVGSEVVEAIGRDAVWRSEGDKIFLDLSATVIQQALGGSCEGLSCSGSGICTISSGSYHSYRREGTNSGRNLCFVTLSN